METKNVGKRGGCLTIIAVLWVLGTISKMIDSCGKAPEKADTGAHVTEPTSTPAKPDIASKGAVHDALKRETIVTRDASSTASVTKLRDDFYIVRIRFNTSNNAFSKLFARKGVPGASRIRSLVVAGTCTGVNFHIVDARVFDKNDVEVEYTSDYQRQSFIDAANDEDTFTLSYAGAVKLYNERSN